jgi:hypothetical protein
MQALPVYSKSVSTINTNLNAADKKAKMASEGIAEIASAVMKQKSLSNLTSSSTYATSNQFLLYDVVDLYTVI